MLEYQQIKPGDLIISSPYSDAGVIFNKTVILIISHSETGTTGVIINKVLNHINNESVKKALQQSNINLVQSQFDLSDLSIYFGGPVEQEKGIMLHSGDYQNNTFIKINDSVFINNDLKILADIAQGKGPTHNLMILGYAAWGKDQLLNEIKRNDWILLPNQPQYNNFYHLIFIEEYFSRWNESLKLAGINLSHYSNVEGNA